MRTLGLFFVILAALGCSSGSGTMQTASAQVGTAGGTVTSPDGKLTIMIPPGALSRDTMIAIQAVNLGSLPPEFTGTGVTQAYELRPDGLQFTTPATITFQLGALPAGGMLVNPLSHLLTSASGQLELLGNQVIAVDPTTGATSISGAVSHFSLFAQAVSQGNVTVSVTGNIPEIMDVQGEFRVTAGLALAAGSDVTVSATYFDESAAPTVIKEPSSQIELGVLESGSSEEGFTSQLIRYACSGPGFGTWGASMVVKTTRAPQLTGPPAEVPDEYVIRFGPVSVIHDDLEGHETRGGPRGPEGAAVVVIPNPLVGNVDPPRQVAIAGSNGWGIFDAGSGTVVNNDGIIIGVSLRYGVTPLHHEPSGSYAIFSFGPTGAFRWDMDPVDGSFTVTESFSLANNVTDVVSCEGDPTTASLIYVSPTLVGGGRIRTIEYDDATGSFDLDFTKDIVIAGLGGAPSPVSAWKKADGTVYFVKDGFPGSLWKHEAGAVPPLTEIGPVGDLPRRLRCCKDVLINSNFGSGSLTVTVADAIVGHVTVGDGPVGIDCKELDDGNIGVVSTGFNDNTYTITVLAPDGSLVSNTISAVPAGILNPGHAIWLHDTRCSVLITGNGSDNYVVIPTKP